MKISALLTVAALSLSSAQAASMDEIAQRAATLTRSITTWPEAGIDKMEQQRIRSLELRLQALQTRIRLNQGAEISFTGTRVTPTA